MGYGTIKEFFATITGKGKERTILINCIGFVLLVSLIVRFDNDVSMYVFEPTNMILAVLFVIACDWVLAVRNAVTIDGFSTQKAKRLIPVSLTYVMLLALVFAAENHIVAPIGVESLTMTIKWFRLSIAAYMFFNTLLSVIKHAEKGGLLQGDIARYISRNVDRYKDAIDEKSDSKIN